MTEYAAIANSDRCPTHPGALLRSVVIPATGLPKADVARRLGISRAHLYNIMDEKKPVTATIAVRLGKLFGDGPGIWLRMQANHDAWHAVRDIDVSAIETIKMARTCPGGTGE